jgi:hypothetical protein
MDYPSLVISMGGSTHTRAWHDRLWLAFPVPLFRAKDSEASKRIPEISESLEYISIEDRLVVP